MSNDHTNSLANHYSTLIEVKGNEGGVEVRLGHKGKCRFCGCSDVIKFRNVAHTFPEALGNKWVISNDECDECNRKFSAYDDALASSVGGFLTLGGFRGKGNKIRQTGRTEGASVISRSRTGDDRPNISFASKVDQFSPEFKSAAGRGELNLAMPVLGGSFRPQQAYKALLKMAYALMPTDELPKFSKMRSWLMSEEYNTDFSMLDVGFSIGPVTNAPQLVAGTLLKRKYPEAHAPYMIFIFCAGSLCWQIQIIPDAANEVSRILPFGVLNIQWSVYLGGGEGDEPIHLSYTMPRHYNFASPELTPALLEAVSAKYDPATNGGRIEFKLRRAEPDMV